MSSSPIKYSPLSSGRMILLRSSSFQAISLVFVCKADKGRGLIIVDKTNYLDSMHGIISDRTKV